MNITYTDYGSIRLLDIEDKLPNDWELGNATHIRVSLPPSIESLIEMQVRGFHPVERTLAVKIPLLRKNDNWRSMRRIKSRLCNNRKEEIRQIALVSFPYDRRFHVGLFYDCKISSIIINDWINNLKEFYITEHHEEIMGFLALKKLNNEIAFIHLAAVKERYRSTGAALSLYTTAAEDCFNNGFKFLKGRISTLNTSVINLFSYLGATFSEPLDVYLKEV